jgi:hypothetical protein
MANWPFKKRRMKMRRRRRKWKIIEDIAIALKYNTMQSK